MTEAGYDAAEVFRSYGDRVFDIHLKDKLVQRKDGVVTAPDCEIGKGEVNMEGLARAIEETGWSGVVAIEVDFRSFGGDPGPPVAAARDYFQKHFSRQTKDR